MIEDLNETGAIPEKRFKTAEDARGLAQALVDEDKLRADFRARIELQIAGGRPYKESELQDLGLDVSNVNFRGAEASVNAAQAPYFDLVNGVRPFVNITVDGFEKDQEKNKWQEAVADECHREIFNWNSWNYHIQFQQRTMIVHGYAAHLWTGRHGPEFLTLEPGKILFPKGVRSDLNNLEYFVVREIVNPHQLQKRIRNRDAAEAAGWKPDNVIKAIRDPNKGSYDYESAVREFRSGDLTPYSQNREIELRHIFVAEYDGKISHYIVSTDAQIKDYIYEKRNKYKDFESILCVLPFDIGQDGTLHGIKGLGVRQFAFFEQRDRTINDIIDKVNANRPILEYDGSEPDDLMVTRIGTFNAIRQGLKIGQNRLGGVEQSDLALLRQLDTDYQEQTKILRQGSVDDGREISASEYLGRASDQKKTQQSQHNLYYTYLGKFYRQLIMRAVDVKAGEGDPGYEITKSILERLERRGVPREFIAAIANGDCEILAARQFQPRASTEQLLAEKMMNTLYALTDERGKYNMRRYMAQSLVGPDLAREFVTDPVSVVAPGMDEAWAQMENEALDNGGRVIIASEHNDIVHLNIHVPAIQQYIQGAREGGIEPSRAINAAQSILAHSMAHSARMQGDPSRRQAVSEYGQMLNTLAGYIDQLKQNYGQAQEAEQKASFEDQAKIQRENMKAQAEVQRKNVLAEAEVQRKQMKTQADIAATDAKTASEIRKGRQAFTELANDDERV